MCCSCAVVGNHDVLFTCAVVGEHGRVCVCIVPSLLCLLPKSLFFSPIFFRSHVRDETKEESEERVRHTVALEDTQDLVTCEERHVSHQIFLPIPYHSNLSLTSHDLDLGNTVRVTENNTNLRRSGTLLGQLANLVNDLLGGGLEPCWRGARVWDGGGRNSLSVAVHATHLGDLLLGVSWAKGVVVRW